MAQSSPTRSDARQTGTLFGIPMGELGLFASLLLGTAAGFAAFFASTFCGIFALLFYNSATHSSVDYAISYKRIGLPIGLVVLVFAYMYLGSQLIRRMGRQ